MLCRILWNCFYLLDFLINKVTLRTNNSTSNQYNVSLRNWNIIYATLRFTEVYVSFWNSRCYLLNVEYSAWILELYASYSMAYDARVPYRKKWSVFACRRSECHQPSSISTQTTGQQNRVTCMPVSEHFIDSWLICIWFFFESVKLVYIKWRIITRMPE